MNPSLRLVVAWMVGVVAALSAVAFAAWRGQLWFHDTPVASPAAPLEPAALPPPAAPTAEPHDAIRRFLGARFDEIEHRPDGDVVVGLAYMGAPIYEVDSQRLRRLLPDTQFFQTKLQSGHMRSWGEVWLLVSIRRMAGADDIRTSTMAMPESSLHGFLSQFIGISAPRSELRRDVALAVADLIAMRTYGFQLRTPKSTLEATRAEIWRGREHWRDVDVFTDRNGLVNRIAISNPIERRLETIVTSL